MTLWPRFKSWLRVTLRRDAGEVEMNEELLFHIEAYAEDLVASGVARDEALRRARLEFGGVEKVKEECRDARAASLVESIFQDVAYGLRTLRNSPVFTATTACMLALGIGANVYIFSFVDALVLRPLDLDEPERIVALWERLAGAGIERNEPSPANFLDWQARNDVFDHIAAIDFWDVNVGGVERPEHVQGFQVTPDFFAVVGARPILGRGFLPAEGTPGSERQAVLSYGLWRDEFGADPNILGRPVLLNAASYTVVGVMEPRFDYPVGARLWAPLAFTPELAGNRQAHYLRAIAHLRPGVSLTKARQEMSLIASGLAGENPKTNNGRDVAVEPLLESEAGSVRAPLAILLLAVGFVLLISCANISHLLLARAERRRREMAVRAALGAARGRLVRQLLVESLLLGALGGTLGVAVAYACLRVRLVRIPPPIEPFVPGLSRLGIDLPVLAFSLAVSLATGIAFGLLPALRGSRTNVNACLKEGTRAQGGTGRSRIRGALIVTEVAMSLVLLVGAGLLIRSFVRLMRSDPGFDTARVVTLFVSLPQAKYPTDARIASFFDQVVGRVEALPDVESAAACSILPMTGMNSTRLFRVEGLPDPEPGHEPEANSRSVSPGYFHALRIPVVRGRSLRTSDSAAAAPVVVVNGRFVDAFLSGSDPIGRHIRLGAGGESREPSFEIVGVVGDIRNDLLRPPRPEMYFAEAQHAERTMALVVRARGAAAEVLPGMRAAVSSLDPDQPVFNVMALDEWRSFSATPQRLTGTLMGAFATLALALTAIGLYGVIAYAVSDRAREIGIRMALGADPHRMLLAVVGQGGRLALLGIGLGLGGALALARLMRGLLFGVDGTDPATFGGVAALLVAVASLACYLPARRASRVNPVAVLREE